MKTAFHFKNSSFSCNSNSKMQQKTLKMFYGIEEALSKNEKSREMCV